MANIKNKVAAIDFGRFFWRTIRVYQLRSYRFWPIDYPCLSFRLSVRVHWGHGLRAFGPCVSVLKLICYGLGLRQRSFTFPPRSLAPSTNLTCACFLCAAAQPTCRKFLNVSIADPESPSPVELGQVATVVRTAIAANHVKNAACFPADGEVGMMKGGGLNTTGYSEETSTSQAALMVGFGAVALLSRSTPALGARTQHHLPHALVSYARSHSPSPPDVWP